MTTDVRELTVEQRVRKIVALAPTFVGDAEVITLTAALAHGGTRASQRIEQIADDIEGLNEQRAALRQQYVALREEFQREIAELGKAG